MFDSYQIWFDFELVLPIRDADWNQAFNYSFNLDFLASCIQKTKGMSSFYKLHLSLFGYLENPSKIGKNGFHVGKEKTSGINQF